MDNSLNRSTIEMDIVERIKEIEKIKQDLKEKKKELKEYMEDKGIHSILMDKSYGIYTKMESNEDDKEDDKQEKKNKSKRNNKMK